MFYTGIGSRETPRKILNIMYQLASALSEKGYTLRSGGAHGADTAFEEGCNDTHGNKEIYLPWKNFNGRSSTLYSPTVEAMNRASQIHPAWHLCKPSVKKLHARNCHQIMGIDLKTPSRFVICWTKDGLDIGGTRTAIVMAKEEQIPVFNLGCMEYKEVVREVIKIIMT